VTCVGNYRLKRTTWSTWYEYSVKWDINIVTVMVRE